MVRSVVTTSKVLSTNTYVPRLSTCRRCSHLGAREVVPPQAQPLLATFAPQVAGDRELENSAGLAQSACSLYVGLPLTFQGWSVLGVGERCLAYLLKYLYSISR